MFETASTGALTDDFPLAEGEKKIARVAHPDEEKFIDLPQFIAIARTIHPNVSTSEAAACYREAYGVLFPPSQHHKPPPPGITFSSFMEAAETRQWMSKSSIVSSYISAEQTEHLPVDVAQNLRSLVHMHSEQIKPLTTIMKRTCTDRMRWKIEHVEKEIDRCLFDEFSQAGSHGLGGRVSAMRPLSQHHKPPPPGITFSSFMEAAETRQWMSKSSIVSSYISAEQTEHLPVDVAQNLRSLVHMHSEQIKPLTTIMKRTCTDRMRWKIEHVEKEIDRCLFDEFSQAGSHGLGGRVSAMRPLCAYRRLLSLLLQAKFLRHENGDGFVVKMSNRVLLLEAKKGMKESSSDLEKQVQSKAEQMARSSVNATRDVINETVVVDPYKVMAQTVLEVSTHSVSPSSHY